MTKDIWLNLPVKDVDRSVAFFRHLGFQLNPRFPQTADAACLLVGNKSIVIMLFSEPQFRQFSGSPLSEAAQVAEILISIDAESRQEVDQMASLAQEAGGRLFAKPGDKEGWMYGCGFADPDGHRWNVLYMDHAAMPRPK